MYELKMSFVICIILIIYLFITISSLETKNVIQFWDFMMNWFEFHGLKVYELKMNLSFHGEYIQSLLQLLSK